MQKKATEKYKNGRWHSSKLGVCQWRKRKCATWSHEKKDDKGVKIKKEGRWTVRKVTLGNRNCRAGSMALLELGMLTAGRGKALLRRFEIGHAEGRELSRAD